MSRHGVERGVEMQTRPDGSVKSSIDLPRPSLERSSKDVPRGFAELSIKESERLEKEKTLKSGKKLSKKEEERLRREAAKREYHVDDHHWSLAELAEKRETSINAEDPSNSDGLTSPRAAKLLEINGRNRLTPAEPLAWYWRLLAQFKSFFAMLLVVGGVLCFVAFGLDQDSPENLYLGIVLVVVVTVTSIFTFLQESQSAKVMEGFKDLTPTNAVVRRDGKPTEINAEELVVGDVIVIKAGDKVPADCRIIASTGLKVDNSSLTGESDPLLRIANKTSDNPMETKNIAFYSTLAVDGGAVAVVIATGDHTMIGHIAQLTSMTENEETPLHMEIKEFVKIISAIAIFLGVVFFVIGVVLDETVTVNNLVFTIGIIVANVPEGLLATVTVSLTLTSLRMKDVNVLVKNLESVETLGSTTVICSDKTGTLTQNKMTVAHIQYGGQIFACATDNSVDLRSETSAATGDAFDCTSPGFKKLQECATLCGRAAFEDTPKNMSKPVRDRLVIGDASETGIVKMMEPFKSVAGWRVECPQKAVIPFNSTNKWHLTINEVNGKLVCFLKGAPEKVLTYCSTMRDASDNEIPLDSDKVMKDILTLGKFGERVLGFASFPLSEKIPDRFSDTKVPLSVDDLQEAKILPPQGMTFVGLVAMIDPPKPSVPEAVHKCKTAGIQVIMVTGDHPITAAAIARQVGIIEGDTVEDIAEREGCKPEEVDFSRADAVAVHGQNELGAFSEDDWARVLSKKQVVFARTSPQQKLIIVEHCQNRGSIVAVTGDGVNDSPALKKANIGIAMGIGGSDVSKEAADMILMDDNFASIVNGVEEGRLIFDNLKKSIAYTLSSNIPEITPFLLFITARIPLPLSTVLILCVDLGTDMVPAISLAYETKESDIMERPPRNSETDHLVTRKLISFSYFQIGVIQALAGFYTYFVVMNDYGYPPSTLPGAANDHFGNSDTKSFYGFSASENRRHLRTAQTAFFCTIVIVQWADILICKTRKLSLFGHGMKNGHLNFGLFFETALACIFVYSTGLNTGLGMEPVRFLYWLPSLPFAILIVTYDEIRKFLLRSGPPGNWTERMTYW